MKKRLILGIVAGLGVLGMGFLPMLTAAYTAKKESSGIPKDARPHAMQSASCTPSSPSGSPERKTKF